MAEESLQERNERALNATSTDELEKLAEDEDEDVRLRVARNANTPAFGARATGGRRELAGSL